VVRSIGEPYGAGSTTASVKTTERSAVGLIRDCADGRSQFAEFYEPVHASGIERAHR
jgi:hypothetical protein